MLPLAAKNIRSVAGRVNKVEEHRVEKPELGKKEQLVFEIAQLEWDMFQHVYNTGGRASCQDNPDTFFKMRMSQWLVYSEEVLESYKADCLRAIENGDNLLWQKYARMMETTYPEEYENVKQYLPEIPKESMEKVEEIVKIHMEWDADVVERYPNIRKRDRVATTGEDHPLAGSSMESYLRCELMSYSEKTRNLIYQETKEAYAQGENTLRDIIANETRFYGYDSLEEAEKKHGEIKI